MTDLRRQIAAWGNLNRTYASRGYRLTSETIRMPARQKLALKPEADIDIIRAAPGEIKLGVDPDADSALILAEAVQDRLGLRTPEPDVSYTLFAEPVTQKVGVKPKTVKTLDIPREQKVGAKPDATWGRLIEKEVTLSFGRFIICDDANDRLLICNQTGRVTRIIDAGGVSIQGITRYMGQWIVADNAAEEILKIYDDDFNHIRDVEIPEVEFPAGLFVLDDMLAVLDSTGSLRTLEVYNSDFVHQFSITLSNVNPAPRGAWYDGTYIYVGDRNQNIYRYVYLKDTRVLEKPPTAWPYTMGRTGGLSGHGGVMYHLTSNRRVQQWDLATGTMVKELFQLDRAVGDGENNLNPDGIYFQPADGGGVGINTPDPTYDIFINPIPRVNLGVKPRHKIDIPLQYFPTDRIGIKPKHSLTFYFPRAIRLGLRASHTLSFVDVRVVVQRLGLRTPRPALTHIMDYIQKVRIKDAPKHAMILAEEVKDRLGIKPDGIPIYTIYTFLTERLGLRTPDPDRLFMRLMEVTDRLGIKPKPVRTWYEEGKARLRIKPSAKDAKTDSRTADQEVEIDPDATHESFLTRVVSQPLRIFPDHIIALRFSNIVKSTHHIFPFKDARKGVQKVRSKVSSTFGEISRTNLKRT